MRRAVQNCWLAAWLFLTPRLNSKTGQALFDPLLASYEAVPYDSKPIALADVSLLETMALLHGLRSAPSDNCRVLELGCASGGHLLSMASQLPDSQFVGVDLAPSQIVKGRSTAAALGLTNATLESMSIADIGDEFGIFDYIICHGVYSWVPSEVQQAILRVCSRNLAPNGVAYVSYNAYPGWHARGMVRDMIAFQDNPSLPPEERITRARAYVDSLVSAQANPSSPYALALAEERDHLKSQGDAHFLHEQLEPFNTPVYFSEFARRASSCGLRYLSDAKLWSTGGTDDADVIRAEQHSDFLKGRVFRRSLLCHDGVKTTALPNASAMTELHLATRAVRVEPSAADAARGPNVQSFRSFDGVTITTNNALVLVALGSLLRVAPATLSFAEVLSRVDARLDAESTPGLEQVAPSRADDLAEVMLQCASGGLIELQPRASKVVSRASEHPMASVLARYEALRSPLVPNLRQNSIELSDFERFVLLQLDGSRTRSDVLEIVVEAAREAELPAGTSPEVAHLSAMLDASIERFAKGALLEK